MFIRSKYISYLHYHIFQYENRLFKILSHEINFYNTRVKFCYFRSNFLIILFILYAYFIFQECFCFQNIFKYFWTFFLYGILRIQIRESLIVKQFYEGSRALVTPGSAQAIQLNYNIQLV